MRDRFERERRKHRFTPHDRAEIPSVEHLSTNDQESPVRLAVTHHFGCSPAHAGARSYWLCEVQRSSTGRGGRRDREQRAGHHLPGMDEGLHHPTTVVTNCVGGGDLPPDS